MNSTAGRLSAGLWLQTTQGGPAAKARSIAQVVDAAEPPWKPWVSVSAAAQGIRTDVRLPEMVRAHV